MTDPADLGHALDSDDSLDDRAGVADEPARMSFLDHLDELRRRIVYALYAVLATCFVAFLKWEEMFTFLATYFQQFGGTLIYNHPMGAFMFSLKITALAGLLAASPFVFAQLWLFIAPGLYAREKRVVIPFVILSTLLFAAGAAFAHLVAFPAMWRFFASYDGMAGLQYFPNIDVTFAFYVKVIIGLGLIFQMPLLVYFLARFGIVSAGFLVRNYKYAVLIIVILAAVITPSGDMVTLGVFAAPMLVLYAISIGVAWIFGGRKRADRDREDE